MSRTRRLVRLFAVVAILAGVLVPAVAASAQLTDYDCDEDNFHTSDPDHILYGRSNAGQAVDGTKMVVDLRGMTPSGSGFLVVWDRYFVPGTDGVIVYGSSYNDTICGTWGDDWIWGYMGNDRILGFGAAEGYSTQTVTVGTTTFTPGSDLGDHLAGGKGHDFITSGDGNGLADAGSWGAAKIGGGLGNDVIFLGGDRGNTDVPHPNGLGGTFTASWTPTARGGQGDDAIYLGRDEDTDYFTMKGGAGNDYLQLCNGDYGFAYGGAGDDIIVGGSGSGKSGRNDYTVHAYEDQCGSADDGDQNDVFGNNGNDQIFANGEWDLRAWGGKGDDHLVAGQAGKQTLFGGAGNDTISNLGDGRQQTADGGDGDDEIIGADDDPSDNQFVGFGGAGDDVLVGAQYDDCLFGDYADTAGALDDNLDEFIPGYQDFIECERWSTRDWSASNWVDPDATGNDTIWGMGNNDLLRGGPGSDSIWGNYPKPDHPYAGLDVNDDRADWIGGGDGDDFLYGIGCFNPDDYADGGGDGVSGDTSRGFNVLAFSSENVEHMFDQNVCNNL